MSCLPSVRSRATCVRPAYLRPASLRPVQTLLAVAFSLVALPLLFNTPAQAQISFTTAVDLALRSNPRVQAAEADAQKARASLSIAKDAFVPTLIGTTNGAGIGLGFPTEPPTIFSISANSLVFNFSQFDYIRSAMKGVAASDLALKAVREQVAEDTTTTYLALDRAQQRRSALKEEAGFASRLEAIVKDRLDAGQDTASEYTRARRTNVVVRLQMLEMDDEIAAHEDHLGRLTGLTGINIATLPNSIPEVPASTITASTADTPAVQASFATADAKLEQAFGDSRYILRPQFSFGIQYSRISTYNNSYVIYYPSVRGLNQNAFGVGVNVTLPLFDLGHKAKARESMAEAVRSRHDAESARDQELEAKLKLRHSVAELAARAELASLDHDLAQQQIEISVLQLQNGSGNGSGPQPTPKDEQNARILERQRYIEVVDANFQLRQAQINLLRQNGQLEGWILSAARTPDQPTISTVANPLP